MPIGDPTVTKTHDSDEKQSNGLPDRLHQVVVFGVPDDPHQLRDVIASQLGINHIDAQFQVHSLPGVLPAARPMHEAARLAEAIRDLGVNAAAIPCEEVPKLDRIETVHHLRCSDGGFEILGLRGEQETTIAWKNVALLSVGLVPHHAQHLAGPVPTLAVSLATSHRDEHPSPVQQGGLELLVLVANPLRAFRIDHGRLNYEYLGDRMSSSATVNFRWLIQDLVNHASLCDGDAGHTFLPGTWIGPPLRIQFQRRDDAIHGLSSDHPRRRLRTPR